MKTSEKIEELVKALAKAQGQMQAPKKDKRGQVGQNREYKYADLASIMEAVRGPLSQNGLALTQATDLHFIGENQGKPVPVLLTRLAHESGQWQESVYPLTAEGLSPQQRGSELTYARRYSLCALLGIAADDDDDGAGAEEGHRSKPAPRAEEKPAPKPAAKAADVRKVEQAAFVPRSMEAIAVGKWKFLSQGGEQFGTTKADVAEVVQTAINTQTQIRVKFVKQGNGVSLVEAAEPVEAGKVGAA